MATKTDIKDTLYDELVSVLDSATGSIDSLSVQTPADHVDTVSSYDDPAVHPFLGFEVFGQPLNRGIDGNVHVTDVVYAGDEIEYVEYRIDTRLTVEIVAIDTDERLKDQLYTACHDHFHTYIARDSAGLHEDVSDVSDGGFNDASRPDDGVHGDRQTYQLDYGRFLNVTDFVPVSAFDVTIEGLDEGTVYETATITASNTN